MKEISEENVSDYQKKKIKLMEEIDSLGSELGKLKQERKGVEKHICVSELPEEERFKHLSI
ncbi:MAG: hypothetical protein HQM08_01335 [Candidatus Riflebacteria bacterium]|nr:hypothetical protein [Candidatus Riflebacteria bacterium]